MIKRPGLTGFIRPRFTGMGEAIAVYQIRDHRRSQMICEAASEGLGKAGFDAHMLYEDEYAKQVSDRALFYGYRGNLPRILREHPRAVYIDLGYWARREGHHKVSVNARHPTEYFRGVDDHSRLRDLRIQVKPWQSGGEFILLAGMSHKAADASGYAPAQWEQWALTELRKTTNREVIYRPKPSCKFSRTLTGVPYTPTHTPIEAELIGCHALVTHHSNCAVDALLCGVPVFVWEGVAKEMGLQDLSRIERPYYPHGRKAWASDIAWTQWSVEEMKTSAPWEHLRRRGLL